MITTRSVIAAAAIAVAALAGCASQSPVDTTITVRGDLALVSTSVAKQGTGCYGTGGYGDIREGAAVTVTDAAGTTIALGSVTGSQYTPRGCLLTFAVAGVPSGEGFYGVEISHRGVVQFDEAALRVGVELTLGD